LLYGIVIKICKTVQSDLTRNDYVNDKTISMDGF